MIISHKPNIIHIEPKSKPTISSTSTNPSDAHFDRLNNNNISPVTVSSKPPSEHDKNDNAVKASFTPLQNANIPNCENSQVAQTTDNQQQQSTPSMDEHQSISNADKKLSINNLLTSTPIIAAHPTSKGVKCIESITDTVDSPSIAIISVVNQEHEVKVNEIQPKALAETKPATPFGVNSDNCHSATITINTIRNLAQNSISNEYKKDVIREKDGSYYQILTNLQIFN